VLSTFNVAAEGFARPRREAAGDDAP